ncbi:MAG: DUF4124 domain-containing protein [Pseudomonadota bacterium]
MRQLASFLLVAFALPVLAAEAWRWKDDKGVVHYSDTPVAGAERVVLPSPPTIGTVTTQAPPPAAPTPVQFKYNECVVLAPGNDQTFNAVNSVTASIHISPPLQPDDRIQVFLDEEVYAAWPARMLSFKLENLYRGTHTLAVLVLGADKKSLCTGPAISFHVHQPSLFSPARPKPTP